MSSHSYHAEVDCPSVVDTVIPFPPARPPPHSWALTTAQYVWDPREAVQRVVRSKTLKAHCLVPTAVFHFLAA